MSQSQNDSKSKAIRTAMIYPGTLIALLAAGVVWFVLSTVH